MNKKTLFSVFALLAVVLAGCAQVVPGKPVPRFDFLSRPTVPITVANVKVVNSYIAPFAAPNVDHLFDVTLSEAVQHWADRRFSPQGMDGTLTVTIEEASVVEEPLNRTEGVRGLFTLDQSYRYKARLVVSLSADNNASDLMSETRLATTRATIEHSRTIGENASPQDRDEAWVKLTEDVMHDLDLYLTKSMREKMPFLIP